MNNDIYAVAVGYNFGLIPAKDLDGIQIRPTGTTVYFENQAWNLFKAQSFEESRKIDALLNRYGEQPIEEHKLEPVIMQGELEMVIPGFNKDRDSLLFGGYTLICDGKEIPFDFSGTAWDISQDGDRLSVPFHTGNTPFSKDYFLDDCFEADYAAAGLRINDITAAFLSKASSISEFMVSLELNGEEYSPEDICHMGGFTLKSLSFSDQKKDYPVKEDVLAAYNTSLAKELTYEIPGEATFTDGNSTVKGVWICVYKSTLGYPDDFDNLTDICVPIAWLKDILDAEGIFPKRWFSEYTADDTDEIARKALSEGMILGCSDPVIKEALLPDASSLKSKIQNAQVRLPERTANETDSGKNTRDDLTPDR